MATSTPISSSQPLRDRGYPTPPATTPPPPDLRLGRRLDLTTNLHTLVSCQHAKSTCQAPRPAVAPRWPDEAADGGPRATRAGLSREEDRPRHRGLPQRRLPDDRPAATGRRPARGLYAERAEPAAGRRRARGRLGRIARPGAGSPREPPRRASRPGRRRPRGRRLRRADRV